METILFHGKFGNDKYSECIRKIEGLEINGNNVNELNGTSLKLIGLNDDDRKIVSKHVERVINQNAAPKNHICTICVKNPINTVFTPCGHQAICFECYGKRPNGYKKCSICRQKVKKTIQTFMNGYIE